MRSLRGLRRADHGSSLILVLIIISVVSLVMGVVIAQADTSVRTTVALRDQASDNYAADGATQAVLNGLKTSGINCTDPSNPTPVVLGSISTPFYVPTSSVQGSLNAYAKCTPDALVGASTTMVTPPPVTSTTMVTPPPVTSTAPFLGGGDPTLPSYALLTTGSSSGDFGVDISTSASNKTVCVENGSVASNKNIDASSQTLAVRLSPSTTGQGTSDCSTGTGVDPTTGSKLVVNAVGQCLNAGNFTPTSCTPSSASVSTPAAPSLPAGTVPLNPNPVCDSTKTYAAFVPGVYTNINALNSPCGSTIPSIEWFSPGWYYFNYGTTQWSWPGRLIAGTPLDSSGNAITGVNPTTASTLSKLSQLGSSPGACSDPANGSGVNGVAMVFAGASVVSTGTGTSEICASSPAGSPPVAIYGLTASQSVTTSSGTQTLPAETMCTASGCGVNTLFVTPVNGQAQIYIKGYVYAPNGQIIITLKNSIGQVFNWGLVVRNFRLSVNGSSPTQSVIHLPKPNTGIGTVVTTSTPPAYPSTSVSQPAASPSTTYSIRYINVWTCTVASLQSSGATQCPSSGSPTVQVKVLTNGANLQILSWNNIQ